MENNYYKEYLVIILILVMGILNFKLLLSMIFSIGLVSRLMIEIDFTDFNITEQINNIIICILFFMLSTIIFYNTFNLYII